MKLLLRKSAFALLLIVVGAIQAEAVQTSGVTILQPVHGKLALTIYKNSLVMLDTFTGDVQTLIPPSQGEFPDYDPKFSPEGDRLAYFNGNLNVANIVDVNTASKQIFGSLTVQTSALYPLEWSVDGTKVFYNTSEDIGDVNPPGDIHRTDTLDVTSGLLNTLRRFQDYQIYTDLPFPSGISRIRLINNPVKVIPNPFFNEWFVIQISGGNPDKIIQYEGGPTAEEPIELSFLWNAVTDETISLDTLLPDPLIQGLGIWSQDGQHLLMHTRGADKPTAVVVLGFQNVGGSWQLSVEQSVKSPGKLFHWLGVGDLLLSAGMDRVTRDTVYSIVQIADDTIKSVDFVRIPEAVFPEPIAGEDWHLAASEQEKQALTCLFDESLPARLQVSVQGHVAFTDGTPSRLRAAPGTDGQEITLMPEGTVFGVIGGPSCADGYRWWQIELSDNTVGWAAEADNTAYFLEPYVNQAPVANAGPDQRAVSSYSPTAQVTLDGSMSTDSDPDGSIVSYSWSENEIEIANIINPVVNLTPGTHTLTLTVTDNHGATDSDDVTIVVVSVDAGSPRCGCRAFHLLNRPAVIPQSCSTSTALFPLLFHTRNASSRNSALY